MKKFVLTSIMFLLISFTLIGCIKISVKDKTSAMYSTALDSYLGVEATLNQGMKFIAIDFDSISSLEEADKAVITKYFSKYDNVEIMDASLTTLEQKGLYNKEKNYLDGILLSIKSITKNSDNSFNIIGSKFRAGGRSVDITTDVNYINGKWSATSSTIPTPTPTPAPPK